MKKASWEKDQDLVDLINKADDLCGWRHTVAPEHGFSRGIWTFACAGEDTNNDRIYNNRRAIKYGYAEGQPPNSVLQIVNEEREILQTAGDYTVQDKLDFQRKWKTDDPSKICAITIRNIDPRFKTDVVQYHKGQILSKNPRYASYLAVSGFFIGQDEWGVHILVFLKNTMSAWKQYRWDVRTLFFWRRSSFYEWRKATEFTVHTRDNFDHQTIRNFTLHNGEFNLKTKRRKLALFGDATACFYEQDGETGNLVRVTLGIPSLSDNFGKHLQAGEEYPRPNESDYLAFPRSRMQAAIDAGQFGGDYSTVDLDWHQEQYQNVLRNRIKRRFAALVFEQSKVGSDTRRLEAMERDTVECMHIMTAQEQNVVWNLCVELHFPHPKEHPDYPAWRAKAERDSDGKISGKCIYHCESVILH